jgi:hypothetical protein
VFLYIFAVFSIFGFEFHGSGLNLFYITLLLLLGGLGALVLGYGSVIILGGMVSLKLAEFIARVTRSRYVIEAIDEKSRTNDHGVFRRDFMFYRPALVFILAVAMAWDIHNLHDPRMSIFHLLLHELDVFPDYIDMGLLTDIIPAMVALIAIAGATPSIVLPYFRRFKITGINSSPFHTGFLSTVLGFVAGLGALLTLIGFIYQVLWVEKGPYYYHYVLLAMLGLILHYTVGTFLGRDKAENMVITALTTSSGDRVIRGTVNIQGLLTDNNRKPN